VTLEVELPSAAELGLEEGVRGWRRYPDYQDSGVPWLGDVPSHWERKRLRFAAAVNPRRLVADAMPSDAEVSFLPMEAIGERGELDLAALRPVGAVSTGYTFFRDGDVLVAKITPCFENGKGALARDLVGGVGFGTTELHVLRSGRFVDARFLYLLTTSHFFRSAGAASMYGAGGQKRVADDFVKDFPSAIPPLDEQQEIVSFLARETAKIDALAEKKRRLLGLIEEKRAALISHAVTRGLDPDAPMKDSGIEWLGQVPAHWRVMRLKFSLRTIEQGWCPPSETRLAEPGEYGILKAGAANGGVFRPQEHKALVPGTEPLTEYSVRKGDLVVSRANTRSLLGSAALVEHDHPNLLLCDKLYRVHSDESALRAEFLVRVLASRYVRYQLEADATGASDSMQNIQQGTVRELVVAHPPLAEQDAIIGYVRREAAKLDQLAAKLKRHVDLLGEYRTALISAAVTGKIDVREA